MLFSFSLSLVPSCLLVSSVKLIVNGVRVEERVVINQGFIFR